MRKKEMFDQKKQFFFKQSVKPTMAIWRLNFNLYLTPYSSIFEPKMDLQIANCPVPVSNNPYISQQKFFSKKKKQWNEQLRGKNTIPK